MKHRVTITPLNCSWGVGLNSILRMEASEYAADTNRSIYCTSPDLSWFKMKSTAAYTPYLEPALYGVRVGDILTYEFDALLFSGVGELTVRPVAILSNNTLSVQLDNPLPLGVLKSHYKHFKVSIPVQSLESTQVGSSFNLRPTYLVGEIIVKNVELEIETSNENFSFFNNVVYYKHKIDYLKCINIYSGTDIRTVYNTLFDFIALAEVSFPDDATLQFDGATSGKFRGLCAEFPENSYPNPFVIYFEYANINSDANTISLSATNYDSARAATNLTGTNYNASATFVKKIFYIAGIVAPAKTSFIDFGRTGVALNIQIKNVRFSNPRFDDYRKIQANQLEDLYTNLNTKLR